MWTVKDCFVGSDCWCGIIVSPGGQECNGYGEVSRADCQYIIDALNKAPGTDANVNERHPVPWHVEEFEGGYRAIVTTAGLGVDKLEEAISVAGGVYRDYDRLFVDAVNGFYMK